MESAGDGSYTLETVKKQGRGTTILLHLKKPEEGEPDFTETWTLRSIVKKHSDFVAYPIVMDVERQEPVLDQEGKPVEGKSEKVIQEETLNSQKAIWSKGKSEVTDEEYNEFYSHISHDWNPPLARLHLKSRGRRSTAPALHPRQGALHPLFARDPARVQLYSKRVFIMENCPNCCPLSLLRQGGGRCPDLNLNVSREILQQDALVRNIRKNLVKKLLDQLAEMASEKYEAFFQEFGAIFKAGISEDFDHRERIAGLLRYQTTRSEGKAVSLQDYVARMQPEQKEIYYLTGESLAALLNSPHLERLKAREIEVLLMTDPIDEWVIRDLREFDKKPFRSAEKGDLALDRTDEAKKEAYSALFAFFQERLWEKVKEVKPSTHLKDSVACLSGGEHDPSANLEKILKATGQEVTGTKRVLELNMDHPLLERLKALYDRDKEAPALGDYTDLLFDLAVIAAGGKLENPSRFSRLLGDLLAGTLPG